jgi:glycerol uptake facilitator-like aquaporin
MVASFKFLSVFYSLSQQKYAAPPIAAADTPAIVKVIGAVTTAATALDPARALAPRLPRDPAT